MKKFQRHNDINQNQLAFFELLRAGLFPVHGEGGMVHDSSFKDVDWEKVYLLAQEQSVLGLVLQGIEMVQGSWLKVHGSLLVPKVLLLQWIGEVQVIEQRNKDMNAFIAALTEKLRKRDVYTLLVKGQGVAQCYERPLWRACGDVDLFLDQQNYEKAKLLLYPLANVWDEENHVNLHQSMTMSQWILELHGTLRVGLGNRVDALIDAIQKKSFEEKRFRVWHNGSTEVYLPNPDDDIIYVFTHILQHYFGEGIGLRQICDWCRLLWMYRDSINHKLLESRICEMGLMSHWKAFAALAVEWIGMPADAMPLYSDNKRWVKKANCIMSLIIESGNFGHSRDQSYKKKNPKLIEYIISFWVFTRYGIRQFMIFPSDAVRGWVRTIYLGVRAKIIKK